MNVLANAKFKSERWNESLTLCSFTGLWVAPIRQPWRRARFSSWRLCWGGLGQTPTCPLVPVLLPSGQLVPADWRRQPQATAPAPRPRTDARFPQPCPCNGRSGLGTLPAPLHPGHGVAGGSSQRFLLTSEFRRTTDLTTSVTASKHNSAVHEASFRSRSSFLPLIRAFAPKQTTANAANYQTTANYAMQTTANIFLNTNRMSAATLTQR